MNNRNKKIFLIASITIPFLLYSMYYYGIMVKNAPYKFSEFDHVSLQYGTGDSLLNKYNSRTGDYQYLTKHDSLKKVHLRLSENDLLYLHRKAADLGFWNFPVNETNYDDTTKAAKPHVVRYIIEFAYKRKVKRVVFDTDYDGDPRLKDANQRVIKEIQGKLDDMEDALRKRSADK